MSKKPNCNKMLVHQLSSVLPDDRPITAIGIVEDIDKCPPNFTVVSRTYDQDTDADLWRESGLFIKKKGRYVCFSKTEGPPQCVVEDIVIINERDMPPEGYSIISYTVDSKQKAWRKKQLCYKVRSKELCSKAVTDIIICSRIMHKVYTSKMAPNGFVAAGVINGVYVCYKTIDIVNGNSISQSYVNIDLFQSASPNPSNGTPHRIPPERPPKPKFSPKPTNGIYPQISGSGGKDADESNDRDYEILSPNAKIRPTRAAPQPPTTTTAAVVGSTSVYGTLPGTSEFDGVPFVLNPRLSVHSDSSTSKLPVIKVWTQKDLDKEFSYEFRAERET